MLSTFQKHQVEQMTGLSREQVNEVLEAIAYVKQDTPVFVGNHSDSFNTDTWTETRQSGRRKRQVKLTGTNRRGGKPLLMNLRP